MQIWHGQEGLDVYAEVHQNFYNELTHLVFLPGVFYGAFRGIPSLFPHVKPIQVIVALSMIYCTYYTYTIDLLTGVTTFLTMSPYMILAQEHLEVKERNHFVEALAIAAIALIIQEGLGHTLFEEMNSRLTIDYVFNAIMFSPLYYVMNVHRIVLILQIYLVLFLF